MPNWCSNNLYIKGDGKELERFIQSVTNSPEKAESRKQKYDILQNLYPCPQELLDTKSPASTSAEPNPNWIKLLEKGEITQEWYDHLVKSNAEGYTKAQENRAKYGYTDWYDWENSKWGTKWGDCDTWLNLTESYVEFGFQTPWGPPLNGIANIAVLFPKLEFALSYIEEGMDFYGLATFDNTGDYIDNCEEVSSISGVPEIDWDSDNYDEQLEVRDNAIILAREQLLSDAGIL